MKQKNRGAVLISIQPKWCELIANGKKTVEVRKTKPKLDVPFKVYIYCTNSKDMLWILRQNERNSERIASIFTAKDGGGVTKANGKVIGEFVCNNIDNHTLSNLIVKEDAEKTLSDTCLTKDEVLNYLGYKKGTNIFACKNYDFYGWHISDLVIYDKPKELSEFWSADKCPYASEDGCTYKFHCLRAGQTKRCGNTLTRPPQSWCYVEKGGGDDANA